MMMDAGPEARDGLTRRAFARRSAWAGASALGLLGRRSARADGKPAGVAPTAPVRVRAWAEGTAPRSVYPDGIEGALAGHLGRRDGLVATPARLDDPDAGLDDAALDATDVLVWWGRLRHDDLPSDRASAVVERVRAGRLGLIVLHASYASRPFRELMGTPCEPACWRDDGRPERVEVQTPGHPIARGIGPFTIPRSAMYAEPFAVPDPEAVVLVSSWERGETFRSAMTWTVDRGRVVYLRPGHHAFPDLFHPSIRRVVANASLWAARRA